MPEFAVGHFSSGSSQTTHSLTTVPVGFIGLAGSTASPNTTRNDVAAWSLGFGNAAITRSASYGAWFQNSSLNVGFDNDVGGYWAKSVTTQGFLQNFFLDTASVTSASLVRGDGPTSQFGPPMAFALLDGSNQVSSGSSATVSTVAGSTQASTGMGFTPNAVMVTGGSSGTSYGNFSVGFAAVSTAGVISQWAVSLYGENIGGNALRSHGTTGHVFKLHNPNPAETTRFAVRVTSFRSSGVELTVDNTDTAVSAVIQVWGIQAPKAQAGVVQANSSNVAVATGLGKVGLAFVACLDSTAVETTVSGNSLSLGFMSSNGDQRSVGGHSKASPTAGDIKSYFNTTGLVTVCDTAGVKYTGAGSVIGGGFRVAPDGLGSGSSGFAGKYVYYGALTDTGVADLVETVAIRSSVSMDAAILREFDPQRGKVAALAKMITDVATKGGGFDDVVRNTVTNSSSPDVTLDLDVSTAARRIGVAGYQNAKHVVLVPPSTNTHPFYVSAAGNSGGVKVSSQAFTAFPIPEDVGEDLWLYTTSTSGIPGMRVILR